MGNINYRQIFERKKEYERRILKVCPTAKNESGIYIFLREENGFKYAYIGQSVKVLDRLGSHLAGYTQHIDKSIKAHKLFSEENPHGWKIECLYFPTEQLNEKEQYYIKLYANNGYQVRNRTSGSQDGDKFSIAENKSPKNYTDGVLYGEKKTLRKIKELFEKYLDVSVKDKPNKIKERKLQEFKDLLSN